MPSGKARKTRSLTQPRPQALTSASQIGGAAVTSLQALTHRRKRRTRTTA